MRDAVSQAKIQVLGLYKKINGTHLFSKQRKILEYMQLVFMDQMMINQEILPLATNILYKDHQMNKNFHKVLI